MRYAAILIASLALAQESLAPAERLIANGQYQSALDALRKDSDRSFRWHLFASKAYEGIKDPGRAVAEAEAALALAPRNEAAHLQLGQIFLSNNTPLGAYEVFHAAQEMFPDSFLVRLGKGIALKELSRYEEAAGELRTCLRQQPSSGVTFDALATVLLHSAQFDKLQKTSEAYANRNPADFRGYFYLAAARDGAGLADDASLKLLKRSLELNPDFAASLSLLGKLLLRRNLTKDAMVALERAVALRPDHVPSHIALANAYRKLGREADATREFQAVRDLHEKERTPAPSLKYHRGTYPP